MLAVFLYLVLCQQYFIILFFGVYITKNKRYTIIAYPCSVIPPLIWKLKLVDHWKASIRLLKEEYALKYELIDYILKYGDQDSIQRKNHEG